LTRRIQIEVLEERCLLSYAVADLGTLGGTQAFAGAINNGGQVVGGSSLPGDTAAHAFLWQHGTMADLGTLGGSFSQASAINGRGQVVGASTIPGDSANHAFLWQNGTMTDLGTLGGSFSEAFAINDRGQVVGDSTTPGDSADHAFLWQNGTMTDRGTFGGSFSVANGINNRGQVVGYAATLGDQQTDPFLWQHGSMTDLGNPLGGTITFANGINNRGQVVGTALQGQFVEHAVLWQDGTATDLGTLGGQLSEAFAINSSGVVLGDSTTASMPFTFDPFIFSKGTMTDLYTLLPPGVGFTNLSVGINGINDSGQLVCNAVDSHFNERALLLTPGDDNHVRTDKASDVIIATLSASPADSQQTQIAAFGHSQGSVVSPPLPGRDALSSPQGTVSFSKPSNDRLHPFASSHRHAAEDATWEMVGSVFADVDN
jgi:probable HAF family extracellular repeat protein